MQLSAVLGSLRVCMASIGSPLSFNLLNVFVLLWVDSTFRRRLKAELFSRAYGVSINI